jgi:hypothetical protein
VRKGEAGWEKYVPHKVVEAIKDNGLFGYPLPKTSSTPTTVVN